MVNFRVMTSTQLVLMLESGKIEIWMMQGGSPYLRQGKEPSYTVVKVQGYAIVEVQRMVERERAIMHKAKGLYIFNHNPNVPHATLSLAILRQACKVTYHC